MQHSEYISFFKDYNINLKIENVFYIKSKNLSIEDNLHLIERLKRCGYSLGYYHQKEIEKRLNTFSWLSASKEGMLVRIAKKNTRMRYTSDGVVFYNESKFLFDDQLETNIVIGNEDCDKISTNRDVDFQTILSEYYKTKSFKNKFIVYLLNFLKFNVYENLLTIYLDSYKEGLVDYLKENDEKSEEYGSLTHSEEEFEFIYNSDKSKFIIDLII